MRVYTVFFIYNYVHVMEIVAFTCMYMYIIFAKNFVWLPYLQENLQPIILKFHKYFVHVSSTVSSLPDKYMYVVLSITQGTCTLYRLPFCWCAMNVLYMFCTL